MIHLVKFVLMIIIYLYSYIVFSQNDTINDPFISYEEKIVTSLSIQHNSDVFYLSYKDDAESLKATLTPNMERKLNFNFTYKLIDFSLGFAPSFLKTGMEQSKSKNFNFGFRFNHKKWSQSLIFINQKGFYIELNDIGTVYLPQFKSMKIGGTTSYVLNDKFSYKTLFNQNQWQRKSAGSFIPQFSFFYTSLKSREKIDEFDMNIYSITISPSYYYNFVINKNFMIGAGANIGLGTTIINNSVDPIMEFSTNIRIGYNIDSFFSFIGYNATTFAFENKTNSFNNAFNSIKLEVGYRFKTPKKFKKAYDNTLRLLPVKL